MKICDLTQSYAETGGGVRTYLHAKRSHIVERTDAEHVLIVPGASDGAEHAERSSVYRVASPPVPGGSAYRLLLRSDKVLRLLRRERPDIVEVQCAYTLPWTAFWHRRRHGGRVVGVYMTDFPAAYVGPAAARLVGHRAGRALRTAAERYARALYRRCDATVAISPALLDRLLALGVDNARCIPLGVDLELFHPSRRDAALRRRLGAGERDPVLIYAGRLDAEKRPQQVVDAFEQLPESSRAVLVLVGDGPLRAELAARAERSPRLHVLPFERDRRALATLLASADIYVSAMPHETFGLSVVEAQACGLPVVGVRSGAMVDRVPPGTGELVPPDSPAALAEALHGRGREEWRALGRAARAHVRAGFSWRATFGRLLRLYRRLCSGAAGGAEAPSRVRARAGGRGIG